MVVYGTTALCSWDQELLDVRRAWKLLVFLLLNRRLLSLSLIKRSHEHVTPRSRLRPPLLNRARLSERSSLPAGFPRRPYAALARCEQRQQSEGRVSPLPLCSAACIPPSPGRAWQRKARTGPRERYTAELDAPGALARCPDVASTKAAVNPPASRCRLRTRGSRPPPCRRCDVLAIEEVAARALPRSRGLRAAARPEFEAVVSHARPGLSFSRSTRVRAESSAFVESQ